MELVGPPLYIIQDVLVKRPARAQRNDEKIKLIMNRLQTSAYKKHAIKYELLCRGNEGEKKLGVSKGLQENVIKRAHEVGHFNTKKIFEPLTREYWME